MTVMTENQLRDYLQKLITEKGKNLDQCINIPEAANHIGFTYSVLIDWIVAAPVEVRQKVQYDLTMIDFKNGDVFHCLHFLAGCVAKHLNKQMGMN